MLPSPVLPQSSSLASAAEPDRAVTGGIPAFEGNPAFGLLAQEEMVRRVLAGAHLLERAQAEHCGAIVLDQTGLRSFRVGMLNPDSVDLTHDLARTLHTTTQLLEFLRLKPEEFEALFAVAYRRGVIDAGLEERAAARSASSWREMEQEDADRWLPPTPKAAVELREADSRWAWGEREIAPTTRECVKRVLLEALVAGASDIHIEPSRPWSRIRFRCDSVLYPRWIEIPEDTVRRIINAVASMGSLRQELLKFEPYEATIPVRLVRRDGSVLETEYRVSSLPSKPWPDMVLRLNPEPITDLGKIGFLPEQLEQVLEGLAYTEGLILVTGRTGAGKSQTLQSIYAYYQKHDDLKVIEFAEPLEFMSDGRTQVSITEYCSWDKGLRGALRHDPDLISPAECRDTPTAHVLVSAALTGHVVPTTLHTANVALTFGRLSRLEVPANLQADALRMIISQRLLRSLCRECRVIDERASEARDVPIYRASGCVHCYGKGYSGQTAVAEVLLVRPEIRDWIAAGLSGHEIVQRSVDRGWMIPMQQAAETKLRQGDTSSTEIDRVMKLSLSGLGAGAEQN